MIAVIESVGWVGAVLISSLAVVVATAMTFSALAFSLYRGVRLKDWLARRWNARRREVLHLDIQNGFYFFMEWLIPLAKRLLWLSAALGVAGALWCPRALPVIVLIVSLGMVCWGAVSQFIARHRSHLFAGLLAYDGYGSIARARIHWRSRERAAHTFFFGATAVFFAAVFILLTLH